MDDALAFTAVAENTADSCNDGVDFASVVGFVDEGGYLLGMERLESPWKVERIAAEIVSTLIRLTLVTNADDSAVPAAAPLEGAGACQLSLGLDVTNRLPDTCHATPFE